jgi:hypothetical protein
MRGKSFDLNWDSKSRIFVGNGFDFMDLRSRNEGR